MAELPAVLARETPRLGGVVAIVVVPGSSVSLTKPRLFDDLKVVKYIGIAARRSKSLCLLSLEGSCAC